MPLAAQQAGGPEQDLLDFCVSNPANCAISVNAIDGGWERHLNPDRPQVLASTTKILMLLAYAQAVVDGAIDPDETIDREEWARYLTADGGALKASWEDLGRPTRVSWGDLVRMMILHSDNATPDLLIKKLGAKRVAAARKLFRGFHDIPAAISAMFGLWTGANGVAGTGDRIADEYGSFGVRGYQKELDRFFKSLETAAAVETNRASLCVRPPWESGGACEPPSPGTALESVLQLENAHFMRSTTRTYADLMAGLLEGTLLSVEVEAVVRPIIEQWLVEFPVLKPTFSRFGFKPGSLASVRGTEVLTGAYYMQLVSGQRFVVVVFLQGLSSTSNAPTSDDVNEFALNFAATAAFRKTVKATLEAVDPRPEVIGQILKLKSKKKVTLRGRAENTGPKATGSFVVRLYVSDDNVLDEGDALLATAEVKRLKANRGKNFTLKGRVAGGATGKYVLMSVDDDDVLSEQDEANNLLWQRIR